METGGPHSVCRRGPSSGDRKQFVQGFLALGLCGSGRVQVSHLPVHFAGIISLPLPLANINQLCADSPLCDSFLTLRQQHGARPKQELNNCYLDLAE